MTAAISLESEAAARYPLLLDLAGRATLVVAGGPVALASLLAHRPVALLVRNS